MLPYIAAGLGALSLLFAASAVRALRGRRWLATAGSAGGGLLLLSLAALGATLATATYGYRALTREELAATVTTVPTGPRTFQAFVELPDGRAMTLPVMGDQVLVDAHILKWHPLANLIGLHTQYELDRIAGRYRDLAAERTLPRTVHSLKADKPLDLYVLARRHALLGLLVDTEYGSATYVDVTRPARFQVLVSTTGLLVREVALEQ